MFRLFCWFMLLALSSVSTLVADEGKLHIATGDWPWWRGPTRNGVAEANQSPPREWNEEKNVLWKVPVLGRGHASPTVVGDRVFLAVADENREVQAVTCYDRQTGQELWLTVVHEGGFEFADKQPNKKGSRASSTVACDGEQLFVNFLNHGAVWTTALSLEGKQLWQTKICEYQLHQGYGSSPAVYGPLVIAVADNMAGGSLVAMQRTTGKVVWREERPKLPNYPSPIVLSIAGQDQLVLTGCDLVASYEPLTGKKLWEVSGATTECVTSTVTDGKLVITSGGYPENHISAMRADGSGEIVWKNNTRIYVPSMLVREEHLYAVTDAGVAICYEMSTGKSTWKHRLGTTFTSSPVLVGKMIYVTSDEGKTFIYKATPERFELIGENELVGEVFATPAICGSQIYMRLAKDVEGRRQEMLYCIGKQGDRPRGEPALEDHAND